MCKKNERLIYMTEAHIISGGNYFDDNVKNQETEDDRAFFLFGGISFSVLCLCIN
jgi:hypothetical protein